MAKMYENGQMVYAGDLLLQIDTSYEKKQLENIILLANKYRNECIGLVTLLNAIEQNANIIESDIPVMTDRYEAYKAEYKRLQNLIDIAKSRYVRNAKTPAGLISLLELEELNSIYRQNLYTFESWRSDQITQLREELTSMIEKQKETELIILQLERYIKNASLYAPLSGKINEIKAVHKDESVVAGEEIIRIIPETETLKAVIQVNPAYITKLKLKQKVTLRFQGLTPSRYGEAKASIQLIPADATIINNEAFFSVEAILDKSYLSSKEEKIMLHTGMTAEARIVVGFDTVFKTLLRKLDFIF